MKSFLKKLEHLVDIIDGEMQQPIVKVLTGEVFTSDASSQAHHYNAAEQVTQPTVQPVVPAANPARDTRPVDANAICPPRLRPVAAHKK